MLGAGDVDYMDPNISYYSVGYLALRLWSRQLFTYPADPGGRQRPSRCRTWPPRSRPPPTAGSAPTARPTRSRSGPGAQWNTTPARQVTAEDVVRGVKRTVQPGPAVRRHPRLRQPDRRATRRSATASPRSRKTPAAIAGVHRQARRCPGWSPRTTDHGRVHADPPGDVLRRHADPAGLLAGPDGGAQVPAGQHRARPAPDLRRPVQGRRRGTRPRRSSFTRNPAWNASTDPVRKAYVDKVVVNETVSQDSIQQQLQTGTPSADMEFDQSPPPSQLPAPDRQEGPEPQPRRDRVHQPVHRLQHRVAEQQRAR